MVQALSVPPGPDPIASVVAHFEQPLLRYATGIIGDRERAREVVQDTFVRLCEVDDEDLVEGRLSCWLYAVCRNRAIDVRRKNARLSGEDAPEVPVAPEAEDACAFQDVMAEIASLSPRQREVLKLRYLDERSYQEISERTGLSVSLVGVVLHQAIKSLRVRLVVTPLLLLFAAGLVGYAFGQRSGAEHVRTLRHAPPIVVPPSEAEGLAAPEDGALEDAAPEDGASSSDAPPASSAAPSAAPSSERRWTPPTPSSAPGSPPPMPRRFMPSAL